MTNTILHAVTVRLSLQIQKLTCKTQNSKTCLADAKKQQEITALTAYT